MEIKHLGWKNYREAYFENLIQPCRYNDIDFFEKLIEYLNMEYKFSKEELIQWIEPIKRFLNQIIYRHRKYKVFFKNYLKQFKVGRNNFEIRQLCEIVRKLLLHVLPNGLFGNRNNFEHFLKDILKFMKRPIGYCWSFSYKKNINMTDIPWIEKVPNNLKIAIYYGVCSWLVMYYIIPFLGSKFARCFGSKSADTPLYFKKSEYYKNQSEALQNYLQNGYIELIGSTVQNTNIEFQPKMISSDIKNKYSNVNVDIKNTRPIIRLSRVKNHLLVKEVNGLIRNLPRTSTFPNCNNLLDALLNLKRSPNRWIIRCDIQDAFGSINQTKVFTYLKEICSRKPALYKKIKEEFENISIYRKNIQYRLKKGLPQGWEFSSSLCNLYLLKWEEEYLKPILRKKDYYFFRYIDDILFLTTDKSLALQFLEKINTPYEGIVFSKRKTLTNLENNLEFIHFLYYKIYLSAWTVVPPNPEFLYIKSIPKSKWMIRSPENASKEIKDYFKRRVLMTRVLTLFYNIELNGFAQTKMNILIILMNVARRVKRLLYMLEGFGKIEEKYIKKIMIRFCQQFLRSMQLREPLIKKILNLERFLLKYLGKFSSRKLLKGTNRIVFEDEDGTLKGALALYK